MSGYACRICGSADHELILDYGQVALADAFLSSPEEITQEQKYPLSLVFCNGCSHVQIPEILDPKLLFSNYIWETGIPASIRGYCRDFVESVLARTAQSPPLRVVEIASNDGTLLEQFQARGCQVVGVDPAQNIAHKANQRGIPTVPDFFTAKVAANLLATHGPADVCVARNVLGHAADVHGLVAGIRVLLAPWGTAVIEVPHLLTMYQELQFDQVFHEHIGYHSLDSVMKLLRMHELAVVDVESTWIHGGSIRVYCAHQETDRKASARVEELVAEEQRRGILGCEAWRDFALHVAELKGLLMEELVRVRAAGGEVVGYGASAKGQSLIQYCELTPDLIAFIVDKSQMKIGKLTPGSHIPVYDPARMREGAADVVLLFAWNFADEILEQERELRQRGVRFLHPIPVPHYL